MGESAEQKDCAAFAVGAAGLEFTVKVDALVAVPKFVVTLIVPVVPLPTVAVIWVALFTT